MCGDRSVIRHGEAACAVISDSEEAVIRPRAPAHAHSPVAVSLITHHAMDIRHITRAGDREATCASSTDREIAIIRPPARTHDHRAVAAGLDLAGGEIIDLKL